MKMKHRPEAGVDESGAVLFAGAHTLQLGTQLLALLGKLGIFDDMVIYALFIIGPHVGDDGLNLVNAHTGLDIVTQVVEQQYPLLVVTDLFLVVRDFTLELVLTAGHTHIFQHIVEG